MKYNYESVGLVNENEKVVKRNIKNIENRKLKNRVKKLIKRVVKGWVSFIVV